MLVGDVFRWGFTARDAGIVDEDVDRPELIGDGGHAGGIGNVHPDTVDRIALA